MAERILSSSCAVVVALLLTAPAAGQTQSAATPAGSPPRTPWGAPDLNGVWDFRTLTPFERPSELADQEFFTHEEAAAFEADRLAEFAVRDDLNRTGFVGGLFP